MQRRMAFAMMCFVAIGLLTSVRSAAAQATRMRCESMGSNRVQCPISRGVRVELARQLSDAPCRESSTWGSGDGFIWVSGGCRGEFAVTPTDFVGPGNAGASASPHQLRACQTEADRRLPDYSYDQIQVESVSREGNIAAVRWWAGAESGRCTVAANGRILAFTRDGEGGGGGGNVGTTTRITCESKRTERQQCPVPTGAKIRLVRQLSTNPCRENDTYGRGQGYVWVAAGCRGEFDVMLPGSGGGTGGTTRITCESAGNARRQCAIPVGASVSLMSQLSQTPCRPNQTYGYTSKYIWVQGGCRGVFQVTSGGAPGETGGSYTTRLVCESQSTARQQCPIAGATQVRLVRQISTNPCKLNQTFGMGFGHIWVSNGCRGEFEVTVGGASPGTGTGLPDRVTCESNNGQRAECRIRSGAQVQLVKQLSTTACVRNQTWGTGLGVIWVNKGCRGEFEVR